MNISLLERYSSKLDPTVRQRGAKILASKQFTIVESDTLSCVAKVMSETLPNTQYHVRIMEANNLLTASCTCVFYDQHSYCKHISAVVSHLIIQKATFGTGRFSESQISFDPADIQLPYAPITKEFVNVHSNSHYLSLAKRVLERPDAKPLEVKEKWKGHVRCEVQDGENYWRNYRVEIDLEKNVLHLRCRCMQNKAALCSHKVTALHYLSQQFAHPNFLIEAPAKELLFKEALKPYGFLPNEPDIDKLFRLEIDIHGNYQAIPLQKGIVKTSAYGSSLKGTLQLNTSLLLPIEQADLDKEEKKKSELGFAYLICPSEFRTGLGYLPYVYTLCGIFNRDRTELVKNISLKSEAYEKGHVLPLPTDNQQAIEELLVQLQEKSISKYVKKQNDGLEGSTAVTHYVTNQLSKLQELLKEEVVYFSDSEYFSKHSLDKLQLSPIKPQLKFRLYHQAPFLCLEGHVFLQDQAIERFSANEYFHYFFIRNSQVFFFESAADVVYAHQLRENPLWKVHASDEAGFLKEIAVPLSKKYAMTFELSKPIQKGEATGFKCSIYLSEQGSFLLVRPMAEYDQGKVDLLSDELLMREEENHYATYERNTEAEKAVRDFLISTHPEFPKQEHRGFFYVHFDKIMEHEWYFKFFQQLNEAEIVVYGLEKIKKARYSPYKPSIRTRIGSGIDWFDVSIEISFGDQSVSLKEVQKALLRKENYVKLGDGSVGLLPQEWLEKHAALIRSGEIDKKGQLKVSKLHFTLLDELLNEVDHAEVAQEIFEKKQKLLSFEGIRSHEIPSDIKADLRHYQVSGYDWLMFLDEFGWGGCLADDMGLGKTLQVITFLQRQTELHPDKPSLVVLPTSLLFNWKKELQKFASRLTYLDYTGTQRNKQRTNFLHYNIILTTYGLVVNDLERLRKTEFNYVILDESQAVKNPESQRYKAVCLLNARNKLVMTGTPIENNTFDLFAQMNFINPGLLGSMGHFQSHFSTPIDKYGDAEAADALRKIISPFLLRRTKEQVAQELPDKTEDVIVCEMGAEQRKVYNAFRDNYRQMIVGKIEQEGLGKSSMIVLDALLKLRQICNSPALLNTEEDFGSDSIKIQELLDHLTEKTGQHKVLVFSQFTQMLKLIEAELVKNGLEYEYLDGQTPAVQREAKVTRFQTDASVRVFLISLKAGGVGLNLTEADYVYLIDPWWNPAVEAQAIDRTHRIGQIRKVFAYRMICKDTIEEKVLQLQERKKKVAQDLVSTEAAFYKQLDKEDIVELFS